MVPIIRSLLDTDFYKFTMGQFVWRRYPDVPVKYALIVRTPGVNLLDYICLDELAGQLETVRSLQFVPDELEYLGQVQVGGQAIFGQDYLDFLREIQLPKYELEVTDSGVRLEFPGRWSEAIYWETIAMAIVNELYCQRLAETRGYISELIGEAGLGRLFAKIQQLKKHPEIRFSDFGTRRRFSGLWQANVLERLWCEVPDQLAGTSNVFLAKEHKLPPVGTMAHELFMVLAAAALWRGDEAVLKSSSRVLDEWWQDYGQPFSIALTDTWGTDFFFRDFGSCRADLWRGLRQDSGDPFEFADQTIAFYESVGVNPAQKTIVFSDGLDVETIIRLHQQFGRRIQTSFGWGTNLTNDVGLPSVSLVIKVVEAAGRGAVKLSDNIAKATGNPKLIRVLSEIFGYNKTYSRRCTY